MLALRPVRDGALTHTLMQAAATQVATWRRTGGMGQRLGEGGTGVRVMGPRPKKLAA